MLEEPPKIFDVKFFQFFEKNRQTWLSGTWQISKGTKSGSLVNVTLATRQQQMDSLKGGHNAPSPTGKIGLNCCFVSPFTYAKTTFRIKHRCISFFSEGGGGGGGGGAQDNP